MENHLLNKLSLDELATWLTRKHTELKRPLRVAHVGNVANNAYLMARKEREYGIDARCISPNYTHVMGFPEWEELEFTHTSEDHFKPLTIEFEKIRPNWFYSGSWEQIASNLVFDKQSKIISFESLLYRLKRIRFRFIECSKVNSKLLYNGLRRFFTSLRFQAYRMTPVLIHRLLESVRLGIFFRKLKSIFKMTSTYAKYALQKKFAISKFLMTPNSAIENVLDQFDIIHFYGSYNHVTQIYKFSQPFVSTEHGTLRQYIFDQTKVSIETRSAYSASKVILVTNQDCIDQAFQVSGPGGSVITSPHPIKDDNLKLLRDFRAEFIRARNRDTKTLRILTASRLAKPSKNDEGKGHDKFFDALRFLAEYIPSFELTVMSWGSSVQESKEYVSSLSLGNNVVWHPLVSRKRLRQMMVDYDVIVDQFNVAAYGAVTADALALGVPVITAHKCSYDIKAYGSCAPVLSANTSTEILSRLLEVSETGIKESFGNFNESIDWFDRELSSDVALRAALTSYMFCFDNNSD